MRLFIGVPIPADARLSRITHELHGVAPDAKPVPVGTWHVTLRFLGDVQDPGPVEDALHRAAAGHRAMPVTVRGLGAFQGPKRARIVWARVHADGLRGLAADVVAATEDIGEPAHQDFVAHATLARLAKVRDLSSFIDKHRDTMLAEGTLDRVVLYRSVLTPQGPRYQHLVEVPLGARPSEASRPSPL